MTLDQQIYDTAIKNGFNQMAAKLIVAQAIQDAINDKIARLYNITMRGVTPQQLKDSTDANDFANKLKQRGYFGSTAIDYANGLKAKLLRINVLEFVTKNKLPLTLGIGVILIGAGIYYKFVKK